MVYKKYGEIFKKLRKQAAISLLEFEKLGISSSTVSDFERGKSMISFEKVDICLQLIGVSLEEYENFLNFYSESPTVALFLEIEDLILCDNKNALIKLLKTVENEENLTQIAILIKVYLKLNSRDELEILVDFLYDAQVWGFKELFIFYILIEFISVHDILNIITLFETSNPGIHSSTAYRRLIVLMYCRAITTLSQYNCKYQAKSLINHIEKNSLASTMFLQNLFNGTKGYWIYKFEDKTLGKDKINRFLEILEHVGRPTVYTFYRKRSKKILSRSICSY